MLVLRVLLLVLLGGGVALAQVRPTPDQVAALPITWSSLGLKPDDSRRLTQRLVDPAARAALLAELKADPAKHTRRALAAMFGSLVSVMGSELPNRAAIAVGLSEIYGELAREVRATAGMPSEARVAFGRSHVRFLKDHALVLELGRFGKARALLDRLAPAAGLAAPGGKGVLDWQVPERIDPRTLVPGKVGMVTASLDGSLKYLTEKEQARCKQENRCRLVETRGGFSPAFVAKQRKELRAAESTLKHAVAWGASGVPRLVESELYNAFVWPKDAVRADRLRAKLDRVDLSTEKPLWDVNAKGLSLTRMGSTLRLDATFETTIDNPAVLDAVKSSIETFWRGRLSTRSPIELRTQVSFRSLAPGEAFSDGSLRLVEGSKNCASRGQINLCRVFSFTTPAHEFSHILGIRDAYRVFHDPRTQSFLHVQDRRTLMGSLDAPLSRQELVAGVRNLARRPR
jgi:hypothetical protein